MFEFGSNTQDLKPVVSRLQKIKQQTILSKKNKLFKLFFFFKYFDITMHRRPDYVYMQNFIFINYKEVV